MKKFTPIKLSINEVDYNKAIDDAKNKVEMFMKACDWVTDKIDINEIDLMAFNLDMSKEFERCFMNEHSGIVNKEISYRKLLFLVDVDIAPLMKLEFLYYQNRNELSIIDGVVIEPKVDIEDFTLYTKTQDENDRVIASNNLIKAIDLVSPFTKTYGLTLQQAVSNFLLFDTRKSEYHINTALFPKAKTVSA